MKQLSTMANNALINARRAKECKNYRQARGYYRTVLMEDPENWEAFFYSTYCEAIEADISRGAKAISNCINLVLKDIKKLKDTTEQNEAIKQIHTDLINYFSSSYIKVIDAHEEAQNKVWGKTSTIGILLGAEDNNLRVVDKVTAAATNYLVDLCMLIWHFGDKLVSEFGENEFTTSINIQGKETVFEKLPTEPWAAQLKKINPSSPAVMKYENRGILKKFWEKQDPNERVFIGCCGVFFAFAIVVTIIAILTKGPPDPAWNGVTACQREYCRSVMEPYPYIKNGEPMYMDGSDKNGRTVYITRDEMIRKCREDAVKNGKCP